MFGDEMPATLRSSFCFGLLYSCRKLFLVKGIILKFQKFRILFFNYMKIIVVKFLYDFLIRECNFLILQDYSCEFENTRE